jgi:hypothetical protein
MKKKLFPIVFALFIFTPFGDAVISKNTIFIDNTAFGAGGSCVVNGQAGKYVTINGLCEGNPASRVSAQIKANCAGYDERVCNMYNTTSTYFMCIWNSNKSQEKCIANPPPALPKEGDACSLPTGSPGHLESRSVSIEACSDIVENIQSTCQLTRRYNARSWESPCKLSMCTFSTLSNSCVFLTNNSPCRGMGKSSCDSMRYSDYGNYQLCRWGTSQVTQLTCVADVAPLLLISVNPGRNQKNVTGTRADFTFSKHITANPPGNIYIKKQRDDSIAATYPIMDNKTVVVGGNAVVDPVSSTYIENGYVDRAVLSTWRSSENRPLEPNTEYYLELDPRIVRTYDDPAGVQYSKAVTKSDKWTFETAPAACVSGSGEGSGQYKDTKKQDYCGNRKSVEECSRIFGCVWSGVQCDRKIACTFTKAPADSRSAVCARYDGDQAGCARLSSCVYSGSSCVKR